MPNSVKPCFEILAMVHEDRQTDRRTWQIDKITYMFFFRTHQMMKEEIRNGFILVSLNVKCLEFPGLLYYCPYCNIIDKMRNYVMFSCYCFSAVIH
jgi:hypothetical protein